MRTTEELRRLVDNHLEVTVIEPFTGHGIDDSSVIGSLILAVRELIEHNEKLNREVLWLVDHFHHHREYDGPYEVGDTTGDATDLAHRQDEARKLK